MATVTIVVLAALLCVVAGKDGEFVASVKQNYATAINERLIKQIQKELSASYIYQGYASYFQRADVSLPGIKKFFADASLEERGHAQSLIDYINKRGGHAQFDSVNMAAACDLVFKYSEETTPKFSHDKKLCICKFVSTEAVPETCGLNRETWKEGLMAFEDALVTERYVNDELLSIHKEADTNGDIHLTHILEHEFLEEQINSINELAHYVTRLQSFTKGNYKLGEYIFDQQLAEQK